VVNTLLVGREIDEPAGWLCCAESPVATRRNGARKFTLENRITETSAVFYLQSKKMMRDERNAARNLRSKGDAIGGKPEDCQ
jgi:hypothetical protein